MEERQFRADLYYRLNVFPITVPPLRERRDDIPLLVRYFVQQYARRMNKRITTIPTESMQALTRYHWPGNIRELQNFIERAVIISPGPVLQAPVRELKRTSGGGECRRWRPPSGKRFSRLCAMPAAGWAALRAPPRGSA